MNKGIKCSQDRLSEKPAHQWKSHHLVQKWYLADAGETSMYCMNCIVMYCIVLNDNICYCMAFFLFVSTPLASKVHCSINGLENSSSPEYSKVQHLLEITVGLFSVGVGLFFVTGGLGKSPPPTKKSPTPTEKSPTLTVKSPTYKKSSSNQKKVLLQRKKVLL